MYQCKSKALSVLIVFHNFLQCLPSTEVSQIHEFVFDICFVTLDSSNSPWLWRKKAILIVAFDNIFHVYLMRGFQKYERNWILMVAFWGQNQGRAKMCCQTGWIGCATLQVTQSHRDNSISFIFLESPHQVDLKNVVKSFKHFFGYFNTRETHSDRKHYLCGNIF